MIFFDNRMDKAEIEIEFSGIKVKLPRNSVALNPPTRWHFKSDELTHRILRKHKISYHYFDELKNELERVSDRIFEEDCGGDNLIDELDLEELTSMLKGMDQISVDSVKSEEEQIFSASKVALFFIFVILQGVVL